MEQHDRRARQNDDGVALARRAAWRLGQGRGDGNQALALLCIVRAVAHKIERRRQAYERFVLIVREQLRLDGIACSSSFGAGVAVDAAQRADLVGGGGSAEFILYGEGDHVAPPPVRPLYR